MRKERKAGTKGKEGRHVRKGRQVRKERKAGTKRKEGRCVRKGRQAGKERKAGKVEMSEVGFALWSQCCALLDMAVHALCKTTLFHDAALVAVAVMSLSWKMDSAYGMGEHNKQMLRMLRDLDAKVRPPRDRTAADLADAERTILTCLEWRFPRRSRHRRQQVHHRGRLNSSRVTAHRCAATVGRRPPPRLLARL